MARRAGKQVVLLVYPGENHSLNNKPNQLDYQRRIRQWFGHYLKGEPAPDWIAKGTSYLEQPSPRRKAAPLPRWGGRPRPRRTPGSGLARPGGRARSRGPPHGFIPIGGPQAHGALGMSYVFGSSILAGSSEPNLGPFSSHSSARNMRPLPAGPSSSFTLNSTFDPFTRPQTWW